MKYRTLNKFKFTVFVVVVIILLTCITNIILGLYDAEGSTVVDYKYIEIQDGDTLWDIVMEYMPSNIDPRESIYEICKLNNISASTLQAGMEIQIPIYH